jgi:hypothetical protein
MASQPTPPPRKDIDILMANDWVCPSLGYSLQPLS